MAAEGTYIEPVAQSRHRHGKLKYAGRTEREFELKDAKLGTLLVRLGITANYREGGVLGIRVDVTGIGAGGATSEIHAYSETSDFTAMDKLVDDLMDDSLRKYETVALLESSLIHYLSRGNIGLLQAEKKAKEQLGSYKAMAEPFKHRLQSAVESGMEELIAGV